MKALFAMTFAAAAIALSGCAPLDMSVFVEGASVLDATCAPSGTTKLIRGSMDMGPRLALGYAPTYIGHFAMRSDLEPITIGSGQDVLAGTSMNDFIASSVRLRYLVGGANLVPDSVEPMYFVIPPGATETDTFVQFGMLTPAASQALQAAIPVGTGQTLLIAFSFEGNVRASTNSLVPMHTPEVIFPVDVYNSPAVPPSCPLGEVPFIDGPCGNSQELYTMGCETP